MARHGARPASHGTAPTSHHIGIVVADADGRTFRFQAQNCPICEASEQEPVGLRGGRYHRYGLGVEARIVRCRDCGLLFPNPFPVALDVSELYGDPAKYFQKHDEEAKVHNYRMLVRKVVQLTGTADPAILDVGCGRGELLRAAQIEGLSNVTGLERSPAIAAHASARTTATVLGETIEEHANGRTARYDAIILAAVLEHVIDPAAMMAAASVLARNGGILYVDVPVEPNLMTRTAAIGYRVLRSPAVINLSPTFAPYHLYGFSPSTVQLLLKKYGFEVESLRVWADPEVSAQGGVTDRIKASIATQVNRVANLTGTASNMTVWGRRTIT